ncbi:hypothetical protein [Phytoactinopolyspora halotolerans]|nr:hypothetical protein [Phytoactinopolyspora halotolerans]
MDVVIWTLIFLGGDLLILIFLLSWAVKKDREKARLAEGEDGAVE